MHEDHNGFLSRQTVGGSLAATPFAGMLSSKVGFDVPHARGVPQVVTALLGGRRRRGS